MKIIFLDIDGVLATTKQFWLNSTNFRKKNEWAMELKVPYPFDNKCVNVFNEILESTNTEIVLSSDWRKHWDLKELDIIFKHNKVNKSPIDITPLDPISFSNGDLNRYHEIMEYIRKNDVKNWVVIDDLEVGFYLDENFKDRYFKTDSNEGIKKTNTKNKIIKKLLEF
jgi:hypothetical protein